MPDIFVFRADDLVVNSGNFGAIIFYQSFTFACHRRTGIDEVSMLSRVRELDDDLNKLYMHIPKNLSHMIARKHFCISRQILRHITDKTLEMSLSLNNTTKNTRAQFHGLLYLNKFIAINCNKLSIFIQIQ